MSGRTRLDDFEVTHYNTQQQDFGFQTGFFRVPTRTGKPGKMGRHFPVREKSGNFE